MDFILNFINSATNKNSRYILDTLKVLFVASLIYPTGTRSIFTFFFSVLPFEIDDTFDYGSLIVLISFILALAIAILLFQLIGLSLDVIESSMVIAQPTKSDITFLDKLSATLLDISLISIYLIVIYKQSYSIHGSSFSLLNLNIFVLLLDFFLLPIILLDLLNALNPFFHNISTSKYGVLGQSILYLFSFLFCAWFIANFFIQILC